jgi:hypothetical protein
MDWFAELEKYIISHGAPLFAAGFLATAAVVAGTGLVAGALPFLSRVLAPFIAEPAVELVASIAGGLATAYAYRNSPSKS